MPHALSGWSQKPSRARSEADTSASAAGERRRRRLPTPSGCSVEKRRHGIIED